MESEWCLSSDECSEAMQHICVMRYYSLILNEILSFAQKKKWMKLEDTELARKSQAQIEGKDNMPPPICGNDNSQKVILKIEERLLGIFESSGCELEETESKMGGWLC